MSQFTSGQVLTAAMLNAALTAARGGNWISAKDYGAVGDGLTDDTAALQAAINAAIVSGRALLIPDGTYKISAALLVGTDPNASLTGVTIVGQSRLNTVISQATSNTPIFKITGIYIHTLRWASMTLTYGSMQTGHTSSRVFEINGAAEGSFYNSVFQDLAGSNFYWFGYCDTLTWWGITYRDMWLGDFAGGINYIPVAAGEPNCRFERMYISCQSAVETLFRHEAMSAQYDNIEVNSADQGVQMLVDNSGGTHVIGHWALEVGTYNQSTILFDVTNGALLMKYLYTNTLTIPEGVTVYVFKTEGAASFVDCDFYTFTNADNIRGALVASLAIGPLPIRFKKIILPWSANVQLCDVVATGAADFTLVDEWNDPSKIALNGDANVTLAFDSAVNQIFDTPLSAARTVTLAQGTPDPTTRMFTGRRFRITKTNTSAFALTIKDSSGATVATIASGTRATVDLVWHRDGGANGFSWIILDQHTY
jgi:hypothetical protein